MKHNVQLLLALALLIMNSCDRAPNSPSNKFSLNSEQHKGFLFEGLKVIDSPNSSGILPDFIVLAQTGENGNVLSPFLSNPLLENRFILSKEFEDIETAEQYFESYSAPEDEPFLQNALNIKPYQVWLIKTNNGDFGKILILNSIFKSIDSTPYAEIKFKADNFE